MKKYSYSADDKSLLTPFIYNFFVHPLMKILPLSIPANIITLCANNFVTVSLIIAYIGYQNNSTRFSWLIPILCFIYLVGDFADGIQARRTETGSPLGEYFDHFFDSFVTGFLTGTLMMSFRITNPILLFCTYQFLYLGQIGAFWERLKLRVMRFGTFSTSEGILAIAIMSSLYAVKPIYESNLKEIAFGFSIPQIVIFIAYIAAGVTGFVSIIRTHHHNIKLFLHIFFSALIGAILIWCVDTTILVCTFIITFYNVFFCQSILGATNENKDIQFPDFIVPISCILFFIIPQHSFIIQVVQITYLFCIILIRFSSFFKQYKKCWYWINPKNTSNQ